MELCFNPRTPRGVRQGRRGVLLLSLWFQSTHPSRGATILRATGQVAQEFQSTHPSRGATPQQGISPLHSAVSIHAPLAGCDPLLLMMLIEQMQFQSTHPSRGATRSSPTRLRLSSVSIHAPLAGCDGKRSHKGNILPRIYGCYSPQIRFFSAVRPTPLLWHGSSTYILSCDFLFTSPSRS